MICHIFERTECQKHKELKEINENIVIFSNHILGDS